jgi:hypothetical protein
MGGKVTCAKCPNLSSMSKSNYNYQLSWTRSGSRRISVAAVTNGYGRGTGESIEGILPNIIYYNKFVNYANRRL